MFQRFTERARQVVVFAQDEARAFKHNYVGTEHILLGLLREEEGLAYHVLESLDITVEEVRAQVARIVGQGDEVTGGQIPFTPRGKKVLELALRESMSLGHDYIGTEHMLLGLVRDTEGVGARILLDFDVDAEKVRDRMLRVLSAPGRSDLAEELGESEGGIVDVGYLPITFDDPEAVARHRMPLYTEYTPKPERWLSAWIDHRLAALRRRARDRNLRRLADLGLNDAHCRDPNRDRPVACELDERLLGDEAALGEDRRERRLADLLQPVRDP